MLPGMSEDAATDRKHWTQFAREWIAWARSPGHDAFWSYRRTLVDFISRGTGEALEVGCGEGRISRELKNLGYRVTATDVVDEFVEAAREAQSAHAYAVAGANALPYADGAFDLVVAYNVLMDVEDVPGALREMRRVLRPGGRVVISLVHPLRNAGNLEGGGPEAPLVLRGNYYGRRRFEGIEKRDGLQMHFAGWSQPLEDYVAALAQAGLAITALREPVPDQTPCPDRLKPWRRLPLFLWLEARPLAG